jgi:hypothetical protein
MEHGPVDVMIIAFGEPHFDGSVLAELERLATAGTIRVLDALVLMKEEDGTEMTLDMEDLPADEQARLGFIETGTKGLFDSSDAEALLEGLTPGSAVLAIAIEHAWAVNLANAIMNVGAEIAMTTRIPAAEVDAAFASLANAGE